MDKNNTRKSSAARLVRDVAPVRVLVRAWVRVRVRAAEDFRGFISAARLDRDVAPVSPYYSVRCSQVNLAKRIPFSLEYACFRKPYSTYSLE